MFIRKIIREAIKESQNCKPINITKEIKDEVEKFDSSEALLRTGGISIEALDRLAFGFSNEDIKTLSPNQLNIKWKADLENVKYEQQKSGLSKIEWSQKINLSEPIDVSYSKNKFWIEDGHHRYYAAKILRKSLNINLEIKQNPIIALGYDDYDNFHRCLFNQIKNETS